MKSLMVQAAKLGRYSLNGQHITILFYLHAEVPRHLEGSLIVPAWSISLEM